MTKQSSLNVRRVPTPRDDIVVFASSDEERADLESVLVDEIAARAHCAAGEVKIVRVRAGKPDVELRGLKSDTWAVSFSSTRGCAVAVVAEGVPVGIDIEKVDTSFDWAAVAETFFPPELQKRLRATDPDTARDGFYRTWVRWEASLKLRGVGFREPLWTVERAGEGLSFLDLDIADGYVAALAFRRDMPSSRG